jgi:hypothetical protein
MTSWILKDYVWTKLRLNTDSKSGATEENSDKAEKEDDLVKEQAPFPSYQWECK